MKKHITIRSLFMMVVFSLLSFAGFSQVATKVAQDTSNARLSLIKNSVYTQKQKLDTLAQSLRLQATAANQTASTASLTLIKKNNDTLAQSLRVIINSVDSNSVYSSRNNALITTNTTSLTLVKKGTDTIAQNTRAILAKSYVQRPSEKTGRTYLKGALTSQTATATSYTVTGGKKLYVTSITLTTINTNTATIGSLAIQDEATVLIPTLVPTASTNVKPFGIIQLDFLEPKQFSTNINVTVIAGDLTYSMSWTGYEE